MARWREVAAGGCVGTRDGDGSGWELSCSTGQSHGKVVSLFLPLESNKLEAWRLDIQNSLFIELVHWLNYISNKEIWLNNKQFN